MRGSKTNSTVVLSTQSRRETEGEERKIQEKGAGRRGKETCQKEWNRWEKKKGGRIGKELENKGGRKSSGKKMFEDKIGST